jgi:hypothetical protein
MFKDLDQQNRGALLEVVDEFIGADGVVHPEEVKFRNELAALLDQDPLVADEDVVGDEVQLSQPIELAPRPRSANRSMQTSRCSIRRKPTGTRCASAGPASSPA